MREPIAISYDEPLVDPLVGTPPPDDLEPHERAAIAATRAHIRTLRFEPMSDERMERVRDRVRRAKHSNAMAGVGPVAANVHLRAVYLDERLPPELWPPITDRFRDALVR